MPTYEEAIKALFKHYGCSIEKEDKFKKLFYEIIKLVDPMIGQQAKLAVLLENIKHELKAFND